MKIYCMSDIHGFIDEFKENLSIIADNLKRGDSKLILLGDYIHGGNGDYEVCNAIIRLQKKYGTDKVIALLGNHERWCLEGRMPVDESSSYNEKIECVLLDWFSELPYYHVIENNIFVHAGIDEDAGDLWEWGTNDYYFTDKYPADIGRVEGLDKKIIAGHVGTADIAQDDCFHDIYFDGYNHYYIDGTTIVSGIIPILEIDTEMGSYREYLRSHWIDIVPYKDL